MAGRISAAYLLASTSLTGPIRIGFSTFLATVAYNGPIRISAQYLQAAVAYPEKVRVSAVYTMRVASVHKAVYLNLLEADNEIYDLGGVAGFTIAIPDTTGPEHNPYRPTIPEELYDLGGPFYDYARENQEILREQHNISQAGDTTFPHQLLIQSHSAQQFSLGSLSRFYHEDLGIIICRYVRFDEMVPVIQPCCPVGFIRDRGQTDWVVTNSLNKSHPDLVVGISAPFILPANGDFGWVIVDGANLQVLENESDDWAHGEAFSWSHTGSVSNTAQGKILGRRMNVSVTNRILPGELHIQLESYSLAQISEKILATTAALAQTIQSLQNDVATLQSLTTLDETVATLNQLLTTLQIQVDTEGRQRRQADTTINNRISNLNFATASQLGNTASQLQNALSTVREILENSIATVRGIALDALNRANELGALDLSTIESQINSMVRSIADIRVAPKGKFPLVDGATPPNLLYLDSGELVYEETF